MSGIATAVAGSAIVGGILQHDAAGKAADAQQAASQTAANASLQATKDTNALQWQMYQQNLANQSPYLKSGNLALSALSGGLGLGNPYNTPTSTATQGNPGIQPVNQGPRTQNISSGDWRGANPQLAVAGDVSTNTATQGVNTGLGTVGSSSTPYGPTPTTNYGATPEEMAAANASHVTNGVGDFTKTFAPSDLTTDPSYQWRLQQGQMNLDQSAAARGTLGSGQNLRDVVNYGQGAASQEYQSAYDRFMNNQNTAYNRLAGLAGVGQTTANNIGTSGQNTASQIGNTTMAGVNAANQANLGGANAGAAGTIGQANAITGGLNNAANNYMMYQAYNQPQQSGYRGSSYPDAGSSGIPMNIG